VSALQYVTATKNVTVYVVKGYDAASLADFGLATRVSNQNYEVKDLDLIATGGVPSDADVVLLASPGLDLSAADADHLRTYLAGSGRLLVLLDLSQLSEKTPQLEELLGNYGLGVQRLLVARGTPTATRTVGRSTCCPSTIPRHRVAAVERRPPAAGAGGHGAEVLDLKKRALTIEALLSTSENSWGKVNYNTATTTSKEPATRTGPSPSPTRSPTRPRRRARGTPSSWWCPRRRSCSRASRRSPPATPTSS